MKSVSTSIPSAKFTYNIGLTIFTKIIANEGQNLFETEKRAFWKKHFKGSKITYGNVDESVLNFGKKRNNTVECNEIEGHKCNRWCSLLPPVTVDSF